jgi:trimeric autotransporter adhesin
MKCSSLSGRALVAIALVTIHSTAAKLLPAPAVPIPLDDLGTVLIEENQIDGLLISPAANGAHLRCAFQQLEGEATANGLWLRSTTADSAEDRFRVMAVKVGRDNLGTPTDFEIAADPFGWSEPELAAFGVAGVVGKFAQFVRANVIEEYSVRIDGVRQDFIIEQPPAGTGDLRVELDVTGAKVGSMASGVRLVLDKSGRELAYHRLLVTDARGRDLPAHWEIVAVTRLAIVVDDSQAAYPVRIDPTFSDADWVSVNGLPGADNTVNAVAFDGSGNLYIGGTFFTVGNVVARRIAKWDGNSWSDLDGGLNGTVNAIAVSGNNVYVGGSFTTAEDGNLTNGIVISVNNVARWDGSDWHALDAGVGGTVLALAVSGSDLYVGGTFTTASQISARRVAKWDGGAWSALGVGLGLASGQVNALAISGSDLYAGGTFGQLGDGTIMTRISKWNGSTWSALGSGIGGGTTPSVNALAVVGADLYAAGVFTIPANNIARWNGSTWSAVGAGLGSTAYALAASGGDLYVGGAFTTAGGDSANRVAKWDGSAWSTLGTGASGQVNALAVSGANLAVGGSFTARPGVRVGVWNGSDWSSLGTGLRNPVSALAAMGGDVYVGGQFFITGVNEAINIARWNGSGWSALGGGLNGAVSAIAAASTDLYVGGAFTFATNAGGVTVSANRIAKWNGLEWSALDQGMNSNVFALAVAGNDLYAGGRFTTAGGSPAFAIAKWNGVAWSQVGEGLNATVNGSVATLAVIGSDLYAGGVFTVATNAGGVPVTVNRVAKWNGSQWSALGSGMNADVNSLASKGATLFAGGLFNSADGVPVGRIAQWDGAAWSVLGSGTNNIFVYSLAVAGNDLYVGGSFSTVGGIVPANNIAKWDGTNWTALGSGLTGTTFPAANALAVLGADLYVGGSFYMAGDKASQYFAKASIGGLPLPGRFAAFNYSPVTGFSCTFLDAAVGQSYRIQTSPSLAPESWTDFTNFTYTAPIVLTDSLAGSVTNRFFRAVSP